MDIETRTDNDPDAARWQVLVSQEIQEGDVFYYGVQTTRVYCRPGCSSRLPLRQNVRFFNSTLEAEAAGFRPCKRCRPRKSTQDDPNLKAIVDACKWMDEAETSPSLADLAGTAGLSPFHFQRIFKKVVGITPKQYFMEKRNNRVRDNLLKGGRVLDAVYDAGYNSSGPFYDQAAGSLGMKPSDLQNGAAGIRIFYATSRSYLGWVLVAASSQGLCAVQFGDDPQGLEASLRMQFPKAETINKDPTFTELVSRVLTFLELPGKDLDLPMDIAGTAFQRRVWQALKEIPAGSTMTYSQLAVKIGRPKAVRAVANACGANPLAVVIPCHRVVRSDGGLGGYRWGMERKQQLLDRERQPEKYVPGH